MAAQDGSSTRIGSSPTSSGAASVRRSSARARSSWPVVIAVRPQQTGVRGTTASKPAAASTRSAAWPTSGARWLVKVSGQTMTRPGGVPATAAGIDDAAVATNVRAAIRGIRRFPAIPATSPKARRVGAKPMTAFATRGPAGTRRTSRSHDGSRPRE